MFRVHDVILSEDIATAKFQCDISKCKGACCVVGDAGAPVSKNEIPVLRKAFQYLKNELPVESVKTAESIGVVIQNRQGEYEINCVDDGACIFVQKTKDGAAICTIQKAWFEGRFNWEKPISCHLYPIRLKQIAGFEYANFEYIPSLCQTACTTGEQTGKYLSEFLKPALIRRYGEDWYFDFLAACEEIKRELPYA